MLFTVFIVILFPLWVLTNGRKELTFKSLWRNSEIVIWTVTSVMCCVFGFPVKHPSPGCFFSRWYLKLIDRKAKKRHWESLGPISSSFSDVWVWALGPCCPQCWSLSLVSIWPFSSGAPNSSSILPSRDHRFLHGLVAVIICPQARQFSHSPHHKTLFHYGNPFWQAPQPDPQLAQFSVYAVMKPRTVWETKTSSLPSASLYCTRELLSGRDPPRNSWGEWKPGKCHCWCFSPLTLT